MSPLSPRAILFDLDGLLIDSEPHWRRAEIEVFARAGLTLSEEDCAATTGLRIDEVVRLRRAETPAWHTLTEADAVEAILARVVALIETVATEKPGAAAAVRRAKSTGARVALVSSSPMRVITAGVTRLGLKDVFEVLQSAEHEPLGKPHPGVYLAAAARLGVPAMDCTAVEDSIPGVIAAKAARMRCIAVPERPDPRFALADFVLTSLEACDFNV